MASAAVSVRPQDRTAKRRPFTNWVKRIANFKGGDHQGGARSSGIPLTNHKSKKHVQNNTLRNNPYPESGALRHHRQTSIESSANGQLTISTSGTHRNLESGSYESLPVSAVHERDGSGPHNRSGAPTLATNADTVSSEGAPSKAPTSATGIGALSSVDGTANSTFSSPNQSERSLTTTLTTIQSQSPGNVLQQGVSGQLNAHHHGSLNNPNPVMFSHQYPVSPAPSTGATMSALPRHMNEVTPSSYSSAMSGNLLSDNASILTLASSSKRRRRSIESHTDASLRAIPPSSIWGGSRESLPLSVLSGNAESVGGLYGHTQGRPSIGGLTSAERASIYSNRDVSAPALASERNSFYAASHKQLAKDLGDAKSLRSFSNIDARSLYDTKSTYDAKSVDVNSIRNHEGSVRSGLMGHGRNDSIPGSSAGALHTIPMTRHNSTGGMLSRRSSDWQELSEADLLRDENVEIEPRKGDDLNKQTVEES